jgi:hypothetical protein
MRTTRVALRLCKALVLAAAVLAVGASSAAAADPQWRLTVLAPDDVTAGKRTAITATVENVGQVPLTGELTITNTFPAGTTPVDTNMFGVEGGLGSSCELVGQADVCTVNVEGLWPGAQVRVGWFPPVDPSATGTLVNTVEVTGGGMAGGATDQQSMTVGPRGPFEIKRFGVDLFDRGGDPAVQAGSAPHELVSSLEFRSSVSQWLESSFLSRPVIAPSEHLRDTVVHSPAGLVGNPTSTPTKCTPEQLSQQPPELSQQPPRGFSVPNCPPDSQIGVVRVNAPRGVDVMPLYNMVPRPGVAAEFAFSYFSINVVLVAKLRPSDNGIDISALTSPSSVPIPAVGVTFWGVPADPSHDPLRDLCVGSPNHGGNNDGSTCPSSAPRAPFLRLPTSCSGAPLPWGADISTYDRPSTFVHADTASVALSGCEQNPFEPALSMTPTSTAATTPTGLDVTLSLPQDVAPDGLAQADLREATVTLPEGLVINPSSADGLAACGDADLRLRMEGPSTCPDASKIGDVTLTTPLLDHPIGGRVVLRPQNSSDPASGELFRIAVEIRSDDDGIFIRLPGSIAADPGTGQLTTRFLDLPQLPFAQMRLHFKDGPRAPLVTPSTCGQKIASAVLGAWSGRSVSQQPAFDISGDGNGSACPAPRFAPTVDAGVANPVAGGSSSFVLRVRRADADAELKTISTTLPKGLLAKIADVTPCTRAQAAGGVCPAASRIGRVQAGAGAGANPFYIDDGRAYLTEGYKGAPFGMLVKVPAVAGPFDLGDVDVRAALRVNPSTAQATVESDPMPRIVAGVPLKVRDVRVIVDRPGFMRSPTSCKQTSIHTTLGSYAGDTAKVASRFQVGNCSDLAFRPRLALRLTGANQTRTGKHPGVRAKVTQGAGQAAIAKAVVRLPKSLALDPDNAKALCEFADGTKPDLENHCPKGSIVGRAKATTPLLDKPLAGDVYFVKNLKRSRSGNLIRTLPMLVVALRGEISINLKGTSDSARDGRLINSFASVPDAPISKFNLNIKGGHSGILTVTRTAKSRIDLCKGRHTAAVGMRGQNGKRANLNTSVKTPCKRR